MRRELWSQHPRFVLVPSEVHVPRSLGKTIARGTYRVTADTAFLAVIDACAEVPRPNQSGTWITEDLIDGYADLHRRGFAHSIEAIARDRYNKTVAAEQLMAHQ